MKETRNRESDMPPTIVLVHGAFAESSSWDAVIDVLLGSGHCVVAAANQLRGIAKDIAAFTDVVRAVDAPVVLAAHSYDGGVISNVPADAAKSCFALAGKLPDSMLGEATLGPVLRTDGTTDLYIRQDRFHGVFCADLPAPQAERTAVAHRPGSKKASSRLRASSPCGRRCRPGSLSEAAIASSRPASSATGSSGLKCVRRLRSPALPTPARSATRARPRIRSSRLLRRA
jgi:pimeloyl-ACP methyl ester carboxylesterase